MVHADTIDTLRLQSHGTENPRDACDTPSIATGHTAQVNQTGTTGLGCEFFH